VSRIKRIAKRIAISSKFPFSLASYFRFLPTETRVLPETAPQERSAIWYNHWVFPARLGPRSNFLAF
jgi:hypothetical protein